MMRIIFMGTPDFAVPALGAVLAAGHEVVAVYTQPPRAAGRGLSTRKSPVQLFAEAAHIPVLTPERLKSADEQARFIAFHADVVVVVAYGLILPKPILEAPRFGCLNLHASALPRWRGAAPIQRAIMAGDAETGVMTMHMEEGLDTGPVLLAERTTIGRKTYGELHDELARLGADLMVRTLAALERGSLSEQLQPDTGATYAKKILKEETHIDWSKPAREIDCLVRGLSPLPGAWTEVKGERLKILNCEPAEGRGAPGVLLDDSLTIACGSGALRLTRLQRPGKSAMKAGELLRGFALARGTTFA